MDLTLESKACAACAKAKRRCGKQIPMCGRCAAKGIRCEYSQAHTFSLPPRQSGGHHLSRSPLPSTTPTASVPLAVSVSDTLLDLPEDPSTLDDLLALNFDYTLTSLPSPSGMLNLNPNTKTYSLPWYLESASWEIGQVPNTEITTAFCHSVFMQYIAQIQEWQARWVKTGSNPYIHKHLYRFVLPRCIQDAYTLLSTYLHATPETEPLVLHMLEERIKQLLQDQPQDTQDNDTSNHTAGALSPFEHLARVQALHIYQTIGLFSSGIRARHVAETQIPTLNAWMRAMMASAQRTAVLGREPFARTLLAAPQKHHHGAEVQAVRLFAADSLPTRLVDDDARLSAEDAAWYSWVLGESVRRMWMVAAATQSVYLALQVKWSPCPGSTAFTTREDLWEAGSAYAWACKCQQHGVDHDGVDFVARDHWERIFERRRPEEVDEFTTTALRVTFGSERLEKWGMSMEAT